MRICLRTASVNRPNFRENLSRSMLPDSIMSLEIRGSPCLSEECVDPGGEIGGIRPSLGKRFRFMVELHGVTEYIAFGSIVGHDQDTSRREVSCLPL